MDALIKLIFVLMELFGMELLVTHQVDNVLQDTLGMDRYVSILVHKYSLATKDIIGMG